MQYYSIYFQFYILTCNCEKDAIGTLYSPAPRPPQKKNSYSLILFYSVTDFQWEKCYSIIIPTTALRCYPQFKEGKSANNRRELKRSRKSFVFYSSLFIYSSFNILHIIFYNLLPCSYSSTLNQSQLCVMLCSLHSILTVRNVVVHFSVPRLSSATRISFLVFFCRSVFIGRVFNKSLMLE